jgi:predicted dehydrogenase
MPNKVPVRIGIVGCGDVALDNYLPTTARLHDEGKAELVAVCDSMRVRAEAAARRFNAKECYIDFDDMLDKSDIDAVINLTPHRFHAPLSLRAIRAGKHVYTEKPLSQTLDQANALVQEARRLKVILASAPAISLAQENIQAREIISSSKIGKIAYVRAFGSSAGPMESVGQFTDARWYYTDEPSGPLLTRTVYTLHSVTSVLGPAKRVAAFSAKSFPERRIENILVDGFEPYTIEHVAPDNYMIILDFGNETLGLIDATFCCKSPYDQTRWDAEYYGSEGILYVNDMTTGLVGSVEMYCDKEISGFPRGWVKVFPPKTRFWKEKLSFEIVGPIHWVNCIIEESEPLIGPEQARHIIEIANGAMASAKTGKASDLSTTFDAAPLSRFRAIWEGTAPRVPRDFGLGQA